MGFVLGSHLLTIFIDDIDEVLCETSKFADDARVITFIRSMQRTSDKLVDYGVHCKKNLWSDACIEENWLNQYQMNDGWVKPVDIERDLGVLMSKDLKFSISRAKNS